MLLKKWAAAALAAAVGLGGACAAQAEDVSVSASELKALMQRLEAAEKRIQEMETQKAPALPPTINGTPGAALRAVPAEARIRETSYVDEDDPIIKRLETLENKWVEVDEKLDEGFTQDGTSGANMKISGRIHGDGWAFPDIDDDVNRLDRDGNPQDRLIWRRVRLGAKGKIKDNMEYKLEMEFANPGSLQYRDVYVGFNDLPFFQTLLIGNQKRPFGLDHINSSRYNVFIERPFVIEAFNQDARRLGIASYGITPDLKWNWRWGFYNPELTQGDEGYTGDHWQGQVAGRLANTAWYDECSGGRSYIHWAVSGMMSWPDGTGGSANNNEARFDTRPEARTRDDWLDTGRIAGSESIQQLGLETAMNFGPLQLVGEIENSWVARGDGNPDVHFWGGYGYISYFLTGEHMPWERKSGQLGRPKPFQNFFLVNTCDDCVDGGWGAWQIAGRYSYLNMNDEDIMGGEGSAFTLAVNWYWNPNASMQFNYIHGEITGSRNGVINNAGGVAASGNYDILGARFRVDF